MSYVYRYIDLSDNEIKYVGVVCRNSENGMETRLQEHLDNDVWLQGKKWKIEYIQVPTKGDALALEGHFIAKYKTDEWYNHAKTTYGLLSFIDDSIFDWKVFKNEIYVPERKIVRSETDAMISNFFKIHDEYAKRLSDVIKSLEKVDKLLEFEIYSIYSKDILLRDKKELQNEMEEYMKFFLNRNVILA